MAYVVTSEQMRSADSAAFASGKLSSRAVMETAGRQVAAVVLERFGNLALDGVAVLCGPQNNGGDGFVLARALHLLDIPVKTYSFCPSSKLVADCLLAFEAFEESGGISFFDVGLPEVLSGISQSPIFVDALFGTGIKGELKKPYNEYVQEINKETKSKQVKVVSIDLPSGINGSSHSLAKSYIHSDLCVALQALKYSHVQLPAANSFKELAVVDIGIPLNAECKSMKFVDQSYLTSVTPSACLEIDRATHKNRRGYVQVVGGSPGYFGAPLLSAKAAANSAAGIVELFLPEFAARQVDEQVEEFLYRGLASDSDGNLEDSAFDSMAPHLDKSNCLVVGPGMGLTEGSSSLLEKLLARLSQNSKLCVLDADALTLLAKFDRQLSGKFILTPHPGEMGRLLGVEAEEVQLDRISSVKRCSQKYSSWVLLKGAYSLLCSPQGEVLIFPFANATLGTAGSGDILAGCLAALGARAGSWEGSAATAIFAHGLCAEILSRGSGGVFSGRAENILEVLPQALETIRLGKTLAPSFYRRVLPFGLDI